jgi:hypothetical protein
MAQNRVAGNDTTMIGTTSARNPTLPAPEIQNTKGGILCPMFIKTWQSI